MNVTPEAAAALKTHKIKWFVWAGGERMPRQASMRGQWGYDVECSCGFKTRTGGGVKRWVTEMVEDHKREVALAADDPEYAALLARCSS